MKVKQKMQLCLFSLSQPNRAGEGEGWGGGGGGEVYISRVVSHVCKESWANTAIDLMSYGKDTCIWPRTTRTYMRGFTILQAQFCFHKIN